MGILEKLKLKKPKSSKQEKKKGKESKQENVLDLVKEEAPKDQPKKAPKPSKDDTGEAYRVLFRPQLSEKANLLAGLGRYVFRVHPQANKAEIRKAVEKVYDVHVQTVRIINFAGKSRRYGRAVGRTKEWKKAIVTVAPGEKIEGITETV